MGVEEEETKPSQNLHPLCMNEMVGGEAAKCSPGRRRWGGGLPGICRLGLGLCEACEALSYL